MNLLRSFENPFESPSGGVSFLLLMDPLRARSMFRGGTGTGPLGGSRRIPGLINGAGTRSLSAGDGRRGSIGGRFRSGGISSGGGAGVGSGLA